MKRFALFAAALLWIAASVTLHSAQAGFDPAQGGSGTSAAALIDGGSDEMDGDKLAISWTGHSNYTPNTSPAEVDATDQLTAHLQGIDTALGAVSIDFQDDSSKPLEMRSGDAMGWSDNASNTTTIDTRLQRVSAGLVSITNGSNGALRVGTIALGSLVGDFAAGSAAGPAMFFDQDVGILGLYDSSGNRAFRATASASGGVNVNAGSQFGFDNETNDADSRDTGIARNGAGEVRITDGSSGTGNLVAAIYSGTTVNVTTVIGTDYQTREGTAGVHHYIRLEDQKTQNTSGGTATSGAWQTRDLNTEVTDTGNNCTLSANQFKLDAGTYEISASAPAFNVGRHQIRLRNTTDGSTTLTGTSEWTDTTTAPATRSHLAGRFTIAATKFFEIQHRVSTTSATQGWGVESNFTTEVYTTVTLRKVD